MRGVMTTGLLVTVLSGLSPTMGMTQTSQFGTRGLGLPARPYSAHALGMGGGLALFDNESGLSPASLGSLRGLQAGGMATSNWRTSRNLSSEGIGRDTRYPLVQAAGPIITDELGVVRLVGGMSLAAYSDRNFTLASSDSLTIRGTRYEVLDTLVSLGGLADVRLAAAWNLSPEFTVGAGVHLVTGSATMRTVRVVNSPLYQRAAQLAEISYLGYGASAGVQAQLGDRLSLSAMARLDSPLRVDRDTLRVGTIDLPLLVGGGIRYAAHSRLRLAGHLLHRGWTKANESIEELGGLGARNAMEAAGGLEWATSSSNVTRWPLRLGAHYATLPFPLQAGGEGQEKGVSVGTGGLFGLGGRGSFNVALARVWRSEGAALRESAFLLSVGFSVRPTN